MIRNYFFSKTGILFLAFYMISISASAFIRDERSLGLLAKNLKTHGVEIKFIINKDIDFTLSNDIYIYEGLPIDDLHKEEAKDNLSDFCKLSLKKKYGDPSTTVRVKAIYSSNIIKLKIDKEPHYKLKIDFKDKERPTLVAWDKFTFTFNHDSVLKELVCYKFPYRLKYVVKPNGDYGKISYDDYIYPYPKKLPLTSLNSTIGGLNIFFNLQVTLPELKILYDKNTASLEYISPPPFNPFNPSAPPIDDSDTMP